jgi:hypothetical protein
MKKKRIKIPDKVTAEILFLCRNTCCICGSQFIPLHIHHIDENPSNNEIDNLIPLCLNCHANVHSKSNMGISYSKLLLEKYRSWCINFYKDANEEAKKIFIRKRLGN